MASNYRRWTTDEKEFLEANYGKMPISEIAEKIDRTEYAIAHYVRKHNLSTCRHWTKEEDATLEQCQSRLSYKGIAKILGRSEKAVRVRASTLGLGPTKNASEDICMAQVAAMLGIPIKTFQRICYRDEIKTHKKANYRMIKPKDLLKWMQNNPDKWNTFDVTESWYFENYDWYREKIQRDIDRRYA